MELGPPPLAELPCAAIFGQVRGAEIVELVERVSGAPCPCRRGKPCPLLPPVDPAR